MTIGKEPAIEIARKRAAEKGWTFAEPFEVITRRGWSGVLSHFEIETNAGNLGAKARLVIDAGMGEIVSEAYVAR